jgi:beta-1,4-N-acetylglucosaminyltransferase
VKVGLVGSAGGHLAHLLLLRPFWERHDRFWVTPDKPDARARLVGERHVAQGGPTWRSASAAARNLALAARVLADERPDVLVSTGAALAVPFFVVARARGIPTVFIEVYDRIDRPSLSGALLAPLATAVVAQWPEQLDAWPHAVLLGPIR